MSLRCMRGGTVLQEIQPESINSTSRAIEFLLQELRKTNAELARVRERLNIAEENDQTLSERTKRLRDMFETNADRYDRRLADMRKIVDRIQGIHGS